MASIGLILETLKKRHLNKSQTDELADSALKENRRLDKLINNLLLATRLEEAYTFNYENVELLSTLEEIVSRYKTLIDNLDIDISSNKNKIIAEIDRESFDSMINNIIENAIKYSYGDPKIKINVSLIGNEVELSISDEGIGIPDNEINKVTQQFYRIGNEDTRKTKGTGLGLFIVNKILKAHNGRLSIKQNQPKGSTFILNIPINQ